MHVCCLLSCQLHDALTKASIIPAQVLALILTFMHARQFGAVASAVRDTGTAGQFGSALLISAAVCAMMSTADSGRFHLYKAYFTSYYNC
jgi:hypothetical protein